MLAETVFRQLLDPVQHLMDVDRLAFEGGAFGKHLHAVHHVANPVRLVANQFRQGAVVAGRILFQKLRRAADSGERVFDLMGQHRRHRRHRPGGAAVGQLAVDFVGGGPLLQGHHYRLRVFGQGRGVEVDEMLTDAGRFQGDPVFGYRESPVANLLDQGKKRVVIWKQFQERPPLQMLGAALQEILRRRIDVDNGAGAVNDDDCRGQDIEDAVGGDVGSAGRLAEGDHAFRHQAAIRSIIGW